MIELSEIEKKLIEAIEAINWNNYNGPEYYVAAEVTDTLKQLVQLSDKTQDLNMRSKVLFAIGNNHAGTYYPAVLEALPLIIRTYDQSERELVRNCCLHIMTELYFFWPVLGYDDEAKVAELRKFVQDNIRTFAHRTNKEESMRNERLVADLLECVNEEDESE